MKLYRISRITKGLVPRITIRLSTLQRKTYTTFKGNTSDTEQDIFQIAGIFDLGS